MRDEDRPLTRNIRPGEPPLDRAGYEEAGGYRALKAVIGRRDPGELLDIVKDSGLRGRGGAGFPTGMKWGFIPMGPDAPKQKYLIVNADEMEPGTFKDRFLLEGDPHQMVEAAIVAAWIIQASDVYIFVRDAYRRATDLLRAALAEAREAGYLGRNILGSGYELEVHLHTSAGRYICGEETALINALEGKRAVPRQKPPFPQSSGLWGRPSVVNNVETLYNIPHIVLRGAEWYRGLGKGADGGTKLFGASGRVKRKGPWELPMGTPLRELLEAHAGGMHDGHGFRGLLPGGASTGFLVDEHLDLPMDFDPIQNAGSRLGTGALIVLDDRTSLMGMLRNLEHFFARESCGWCTPCRDGLPWVERILAAFAAGRGTAEELDILEMHTRFCGMGKTFCAHAPGAIMPLETALKYFRDDFERGLTRAA
ncbi:MAG: NADH-quinone oxidoreductase subunit NuoF [Alphaproteobacteria bacterium]|jgi:NADH-quinone oxidoreductase subunit F|nr:NADH-quinone oxidoreductase subunit NuoF [Alphaproteobacteria bacterium]